ncbi:hypothetical protein GGR56DRAFT_44111 [Xylariaceae sp. FL0804]|nr:hypothetical protein GGR56DRAFT_44111 [Xylariaceae sp. FL0804]
MRRSRIAERRAPVCSLSSLAGPDTVKVVVGPERKAFFIARKLLASCAYFRDQIDTAELEFSGGQPHLVVRLDGQCPDMFGLFTYWLRARRGFDRFVEEATTSRAAAAASAAEELHWDLVNLHMFAAQVGLPALQDLAMDGIQDIYLRRDWEVNPQLVRYVWAECGPAESCRLRKWLVAMTAWTLGGDHGFFADDDDDVDHHHHEDKDKDKDKAADGREHHGDADADASRENANRAAADQTRRAAMRALLDELPGLRETYAVHLGKLRRSKLHAHFKNPQLRLPSNHLRNEERQFGFRQCSFHTHRSAVGQDRCPLALFCPEDDFGPSYSSRVPSPSTDGCVESDCGSSDRDSGYRSSSASASSSPPRCSDREGFSS